MIPHKISNDLKISQSGEISPSLVTLIVNHQGSQRELQNTLTSNVTVTLLTPLDQSPVITYIRVQSGSVRGTL